MRPPIGIGETRPPGAESGRMRIEGIDEGVSRGSFDETTGSIATTRLRIDDELERVVRREEEVDGRIPGTAGGDGRGGRGGGEMVGGGGGLGWLMKGWRG